MPRVLLARCGNQLRPGHVLTKRPARERLRYDLFIRITGETGQLVTRRDPITGHDIPDITATILRVIDDHARTAAKQIRWRITHSSLTASNMQMDGGMLDVTTQSAHPRIALIKVHDVELVLAAAAAGSRCAADAEYVARRAGRAAGQDRHSQPRARVRIHPSNKSPRTADRSR